MRVKLSGVEYRELEAADARTYATLDDAYSGRLLVFYPKQNQEAGRAFAEGFFYGAQKMRDGEIAYERPFAGQTSTPVWFCQCGKERIDNGADLQTSDGIIHRLGAPCFRYPLKEVTKAV